MKVEDIAPGDGVIYIRDSDGEMELGVYAGEYPNLQGHVKYRYKIYWTKAHDDSSNEMEEKVIEYRQNFLKILGGA